MSSDLFQVNIPTFNFLNFNLKLHAESEPPRQLYVQLRIWCGCKPIQRKVFHLYYCIKWLHRFGIARH